MIQDNKQEEIVKNENLEEVKNETLEDKTEEKNKEKQDFESKESVEQDLPKSEFKDDKSILDSKEKALQIESILFTMGKSVDLRQLCVALDSDEKEIKQIMKDLIQKYDSDESAIKIIELEKSYQMCTKSKYYEVLIKIAKNPKKQVLTEAVLETLSIIAYKQPITKLEIEKIRGVSSEYAVNKLIDYNLVYEAGRLDTLGRPAVFATTEEFLRRFGIGSKQNLPNISPVKEVQIMQEVEEELNVQLEV